jgi:hypothetical protein
VLFAYVIVLKDSRDTEQQRIKDQLQINNCALLDQLPQQAHALDRLRATYHCGPGLSPADLTPQERAQVPVPTVVLVPVPSSPPRATPTKPAAPTKAVAPAAAPTTPPQPAPATPSPTPAPSPAPTTPPGLLCGLLPIC